jgi:ATP-dependent RNA helicase DeaD
VEVPDAAVQDVIKALRATTLKGRRVTVRKDRDA